MEDLVAMGFEPDLAIAALNQCEGNFDLALEVLLTGGGRDTSGYAGTTINNKPSCDNSGSNIICLAISQYTFADVGASACTVIAASMIDFILPALTANSSTIFTADQLGEVVIKGVVRYSQQVSKQGIHMSVDELPGGFFANVKLLPGGIHQGVLTENNAVRNLLAHAQSISDPTKYVGIIVTKPPETICVILPPASNGGVSDRYMIFDSHSRPQDGLEGSYLYITHDMETLIHKLHHIFPSFPESIFQDGFMASMYNMFEGSVFQAI